VTVCSVDSQVVDASHAAERTQQMLRAIGITRLDSASASAQPVSPVLFANPIEESNDVSEIAEKTLNHIVLRRLYTAMFAPSGSPRGGVCFIDGTPG